MGIVYRTQLAEFWPPVWLPPTIGAITGGGNNGLLAGQTEPAAAATGHFWNCANVDTIRTQFERCAGRSVTVNSTRNRPCSWSYRIEALSITQLVLLLVPDG